MKNNAPVTRSRSVSGVVEYFPLKTVLVNIRWIRIIPLSFVKEASLKFDIVTCENAPGK